MKITVKNFGPIREAKNIEISPMTIFVGPSNTGKSYLAMLIYATLKAVTESMIGIGFRPFGARRRFPLFAAGEDDDDDPLTKLTASKEAGQREVAELFTRWVKATAEVWKEEVVRCFGDDDAEMVNSESLVVELSASGRKSYALNLTNPESTKLSNRQIEALHARINPAEFVEEHADPEDARYARQATFGLSRKAHRCFGEMLIGDDPIMGNHAHYLPAVRGGIMQSHHTLFKALLNQAPMVGIKGYSSIPVFNGVLADFMEGLLDIGNRASGKRHGGVKQPDVRYNPSELQRISDHIERKIISGAIRVDTEQSALGYPDFRYAPDGYDEQGMSLMKASSSVSELAPLILYIRHCLRPGNRPGPGSLFIVEEPEAHLHPGAQRDISAQLARLSNAGVNVLLTTHSDIVLEQLTNFVYAHQMPADKAAEIAGDIPKLEARKCAVYLFPKSRGSNGTKVEKVPFDPETGFLTRDHLQISEDLHNQTADLMPE